MSRSGEGSRSPRPADTLEQFERLLHLGLGRAVLFLRGHDAPPYREAVVRACVQDMGYDAKLESSRATYLFDVIEATHDEASFVEPVATALLTAAEHWSMVQLFELAALLAKAGHATARAALYTRFDRHAAAGPFLPCQFDTTFGAGKWNRLDAVAGWDATVALVLAGSVQRDGDQPAATRARRD